MRKDLLAQVTLPDGTKINSPSNFRSDFNDLGSVLNSAFEIVIFVAGFLMVFWLFWGIFQYIFAGGNKEGLAKARARIVWALVGFIITIAAFTISEYVNNLVPQDVREKGGSINIIQVKP